MKINRRFLRGAGVTAALLTVVHGQTSSVSPASRAAVGDLGSPGMIDFAGNDSFPPRALRKGLSGTPEFLLAAHPAAPLDDFLATVQRALERGYRNSGFPQAKAVLATTPAGNRVLASVTEGPRFLQGDIRIEGSGEIPAAEIVRALTEPSGRERLDHSLEHAIETVLATQRAPAPEGAAPSAVQTAIAKFPAIGVTGSGNTLYGPGSTQFQNTLTALTAADPAPAAAFWVRGSPASFRDGYAQEVTDRVRKILATRGHALAAITATLQLDPAAGEAHLQLQIEEGPRSSIGRVEVVGAGINSADDIIRLTGLAPGGELTPAALAGAKIALWNSARFYSFDVVPKPPATPSPAIDLTISVVEIKDRPPLRTPLTETDAALVRFANWITTDARRRAFALTVSEKYGSVSMAVSPTQGLALHAQDRAGGQLGGVVGPGLARVVATAEGRSAKREHGGLTQTWTASVSMLTGVKADPNGRDTWINFNAGWQSIATATDGPVQLALTMSPAFACLALPSSADVVIEGDEVVLRTKTTGNSVVRFRAATGELTEWGLGRWKSDETGALSVVVRSDADAFDAVAQQVHDAWLRQPAEATRASLVAPLLAQSWLRRLLNADNTGGTTSTSFVQIAFAARLAERLLATPELVTWWSTNPDEEADPDFTIPVDPGIVTQPSAIAALLGAAYYQLSTMLWPADTWPAKAARELFYIVSGNTKYTGTVFEELYADPRMGPVGSIIVAQMLRTLNPRLSWRFAHRALGYGTAEDFRRDWRLLLASDTKLARLAQDLVRSLAGIPEREIVEMLGDLPAAEATIVQRGLAALRQDPGSPIADTLQPVLDEWWTTQVAPSLENRIGELLAGGTPVDPAIAAFTVNGEPVHRKFIRLMSATGPLRPAVPRRAGDNERAPADVAGDALVGLMLLVRDFMSSGGLVRADFIEQKIAATVRTGFGGDWQGYTASLTRAGLTLEDQREIIRLVEIAREVRSQIAKRVSPPSAAEIERAARSLPRPDETRTLKAIMLPKGSRALADQIRQQAVDDGSFEKIWAQHDTKDASLPRRMMLTDVARKDLAKKELADAAFSLSAGTTSPVIDAGDTLYILHLVSVNFHRSPADSRRRAASAATARKVDEALLAHIDQLRANAIVRKLIDPAKTMVNTAPPNEGIRLEFEALKLARSSRTRVIPAALSGAGGEMRWSGGRVVNCISDKDGWAEWNLEIPAAGVFQIRLLGVRGAQHAQLQAAVDGNSLGGPFELHAATMQPSGPMPLGDLHLAAGPHRLRFTVTGKHPSSLAHNFGLDAIDLVPASADAVRRLGGTPASAPDLIEIISVSPAKAVAGATQVFTARMKYSLASNPKGIIGLGFNTSDSKSFRMVTHRKVESGSGEVELTGSIVPVVWPDGQRFRVYANLSPDPHPREWTPLATNMKVIEVSRAGPVADPAP